MESKNPSKNKDFSMWLVNQNTILTKDNLVKRNWQGDYQSSFCNLDEYCRMDIPGPTTLVGTRTDYSMGPWDYSTCAAQYLRREAQGLRRNST
jgi:hypothetical protein